MIGAIGAGVQLALGKSRYTSFARRRFSSKHRREALPRATASGRPNAHRGHLQMGTSSGAGTAAAAHPGKHRQPMGLFTCCLQPLVRPA